MIFPENFEYKIDFIRIREYLKEHCLGSLGHWMVDEMQFQTNFEAISQQLAETWEFYQLLQSSSELPTDHFFDLRSVFAKMRIQGTFIEPGELFNLYRSLITTKDICRFFKKDEHIEKYPSLHAIASRVVLHSYVFDGIERILNKQGKIRDNASPELAHIRKEQASKQAAVSKLIHRIIGEAQREGWVDPDTTLSVRDGRVVIPVPASFKRKIAGIIHDESATGKTCYVEPAPVVELNNAISELEAAERREIIKILREFTDAIRPYTDDLEDAIMFLGIIDFIRAKARFAQRIGAIRPVLEKHPHIEWKNARHPVLFISFQTEGRKVVPLNLSLDTENRILVISGPNAGGKSVCLKTVGLLQYMLQCGMLIPVESGSKAGIFTNLFIDIGDEQSIENDLSTYSSHLMYMKHFVRNADDKTLVLIDEFGTGTEPMLGGAIAEAILNRLNQTKVFGVITTHYTNLKHFAAGNPGIVNGAMLYDTQRLEPMFILEMGKPGSSFAFEIAYKIGLPQDVIDEARQKVGEEHINFDKHLREILRDKYYWERKRENIRKIERRLEEMMEKEKTELEEAKKYRKEVMQKSTDEAKRMLSESNKVIENTVRQIKEAQAEKEKTKEVRQELETFKEKIVLNNDEEEQRILQKIKKLKERENWVKGEKKDKETEKPTIKVPKREKEFTIGMPVKIDGQTSVGEIMELSGKNAVVAFGNILTTVAITKLVSLSDGEKKNLMKSPSGGNFKQSYELNQRRMSFKPGLDVRGKRGEEAISLVAQFIDEAVMVGVYEVKILHGKGNGILRQIIREYLQSLAVVRKVQDEHVEFGGAGISVVTLG